MTHRICTPRRRIALLLTAAAARLDPAENRTQLHIEPSITINNACDPCDLDRAIDAALGQITREFAL